MRKQIWKRLGWSITALEDKKKCFAWLFFFFVLQMILQYYYPMTSDDLYFKYGVVSGKQQRFDSGTLSLAPCVIEGCYHDCNLWRTHLSA